MNEIIDKGAPKIITKSTTQKENWIFWFKCVLNLGQISVLLYCTLNHTFVLLKVVYQWEIMF